MPLVAVFSLCVAFFNIVLKTPLRSRCLLLFPPDLSLFTYVCIQHQIVSFFTSRPSTVAYPLPDLTSCFVQATQSNTLTLHSEKRMDSDDQAINVPKYSVKPTTTVPVTVAMLLRSRPPPDNDERFKPDALLLEDGRPLHMIRLVGAVRSFSELSTTISYQVEDGTGIVEVRQYIDNSCSYVAKLRSTTMKENIYVKLFGRLKIYGGRHEIQAESIRPLSSGNELAHHFLEVVHAGETYKNEADKDKKTKKLPAQKSDNEGRPEGNPTDVAAEISSSRLHVREAILTHLTIAGEDCGRGCDIRALIDSLVEGGMFRRETVNEVIDELISECKIYQAHEEYLLKMV